MNYTAIINRSFEIAWKYKSLWIFGLLAGGTSSFNFDSGSFSEKPDFDFSALSQMDSFDPAMFGKLLGSLALPLLIFTLALLIVGLICKPALIDSANRISRGGKYSFGDAFSVGIDNFLRFFGLFLIGLFTAALCMGILFGVLMVGFLIHPALGLLVVLACFPVGLILIWIMISVFRLSERAIVVRKVSIGDGLSEGWRLFRNNLKDCFLMALIYIGFMIAFFILMAMVWMIVGLPIAAIVLGSNMSVVTGVILGILLGLPVSIVLGGLIGTFQANLYTMFYFELLEPGGRHTQPIGSTPVPTI